ncbi:hypothetical protein WJX73_008063 [Symbiochloris irregularis]|uniref:Conserved oligomeric Golgi complex subunit 8 n=1 Tax=Symbiochloris irregularis TaxID=706552 RepID=A0AAW1NK39_9CHLO
MALQTEYRTERSLSRDLVPPSPSARPGATRLGSVRPDQHAGDWSQRGSLTGKKLGTKGSEVLDKAQAEAYFSDLLSYSLERLGKEPELLRADQDQLRTQAQEVATARYRTFIEVADTLGRLKDETQRMQAHCGSLQSNLPSLSTAADAFVQHASDLASKRAANKQLLRQQGVLMDILEVPQLMDICMRNGNYDDALDLRAFVAKLALIHPHLQVVRQLVRQVEAASADMLAALLARLRGNIQLPDCLRMVGYLRRLPAFPEAELRRNFLACREAWLAEQVADLDDSNAYDYLKRLTDVHRLQLFDVVMQYRAIFAEEPHEAGDASASSEKELGALYSWATHRVSNYLEVVSRHLPRIKEGGGPASIQHIHADAGQIVQETLAGAATAMAQYKEAALTDKPAVGSNAPDAQPASGVNADGPLPT